MNKYNNIKEIEIIAKSAEKIWGDSYDVLWKIINKKKLKIGAEIGVAYGGHAKRIVMKTKSKLYCIDPYKHLKNYQDGMNLPQKDFNKLYKYTKNRLKRFSGRCRILRNTSTVAARNLKINLDFVYIDANHTYNGLMKDICIWFAKINNGGIISGHDYNHPNHPGVKKAVDEFFNRFNWKIHTHKSGVWWVEKKPLFISFVIPAYNCQTTITDAVESIIKTNMLSEDEIVIIDDASIDGSVKTIQSLQKNNRGIKLHINKINLGSAQTRNIALTHTKNELIFMLDSDNILFPNSVLKLKKFLINNVVDAACFQEIRYFKTRDKISHKWIFPKNRYVFADYFATHHVPGASGNYLFTRRLFMTTGGYPGVRFQDTWGFGLRHAAAGFEVAVLPKSYYFHRFGKDSNWVRYSKTNNTSINALKIIRPYINQVIFRDVIYMLTSGLTKWFDNIPNRPIRLKRNDEI